MRDSQSQSGANGQSGTAAPRRAADTDTAPPWRRMLLSKRAAARLLNMSPASFDRLRSAGLCPRPVEVGASIRWRRRDLLLWVRWRCPDLREFDARLRAAETGARSTC